MANGPTNSGFPAYAQNLDAVADVENWMRTFALDTRWATGTALAIATTKTCLPTNRSGAVVAAHLGHQHCFRRRPAAPIDERNFLESTPPTSANAIYSARLSPGLLARVGNRQGVF
jgi:hypothetical protein